MIFLVFSIKHFSKQRNHCFSSKPISSRYKVPVSKREEFEFNKKEKFIGSGLIKRECFINFSIIFKFAKHQFIVSNRDGTRSVPIIDVCKIFLSLHKFKHIFNNDWGLAKNCRSSFGSRRIAWVSKAPNIFIFLVLHRRRIYISIPCCIGESTFFDKFGWNLWWYYVKCIKFNFS